MFRSYYEEVDISPCSPVNIEKREFGFIEFGRGMVRHKSFKDENELGQYLKANSPSDAYYSSAYYSDPETTMEKKGWLGADLIFDIDADHIPTTCNKIHDEWTCEACHFAGIGITPEKCPVCGGQKFAAKTWLCQECLDSAKLETVKLLDMLANDFGLGEKDVHVFFSGHRGYHVHVESKSVLELDPVARKEIVDYVTGLGFNIGPDNIAGKTPSKAALQRMPRLSDIGWRGRLASQMHSFILRAEANDLVNIGVKRRVAETLIQSKDSVLKNWNDIGSYGPAKGAGPETWKRIAESCFAASTSKVDTVVTTDIHRLIRLTGSLHGKTGLRKVEFPVSRIDDFDPFKIGVAFKGGRVTVSTNDVPEFRLGGETFGPYKDCKVDLPVAVAVLLICQDRAEIVDEHVQ
jgi:DNA primase small subunit